MLDGLGLVVFVVVFGCFVGVVGVVDFFGMLMIEDVGGKVMVLVFVVSGFGLVDLVGLLIRLVSRM